MSSDVGPSEPASLECTTDVERAIQGEGIAHTAHAALEDKSPAMPITMDSAASCLADFGEITEVQDTELMSTSAVLFYCKSKILYPYLKFLSMVGLRPVSLDQLQNSKFLLVLSHYHTFQMAVLMFVGYILQYMACFRRDRGFWGKNTMYDDYVSVHEKLNAYHNVCYGSPFFSYIGPSVIHFSGYIYAIYLFRISDSEQLQNLMERVFLLSSFPPQGTPYTSPRRLLKTLWLYIIFGILWMISALFTVIFMILTGKVSFLWIGDSVDMTTGAKVLLCISTLAHDMVQATIISSYCLQAQLLTTHLHFLRNRLLTRTISSLDWMREVAEFKKLLAHLNEVLAPAICLFTVLNISWASSGILWLFNKDNIESFFSIPLIPITVSNIMLWIMAAAVPFISAARLTSACCMTRCVGHEISVRPFLHQETPQEELNSVLLYASSLRLSARLFRIPISGRYLCLTFTFAAVIILILGMSHYIRF